MVNDTVVFLIVKEDMTMNKTGPKDFYINAVISSKSQKFPGVLFVAACADISLFGNMSVHTSNTCENKKIITGRNNSRSMYDEYQSFFSYTKKKNKFSQR